MEREQKPQFTIREATVEDTEAIRRVQAESWLATYPNDEHGVPYEWVKERTDGWLTPERIEESKGIIGAAINDPNGFYRLAEASGEVVGFVHAGTNDDETKELEAIYVRPDMFGSGLGHQLLQQALEWMDGAKASLEVATYNNRAIRFYEKYGFRLVEGTEYLFKDKMPVMKMVREATTESREGQSMEETVFVGRLFEIVHEEQKDGRNFEIARRAPGVRLIVADPEQRKVLLTREFRQELQDWDYRLPGGKVFDSLEEYRAHRDSGEDIVGAALSKAKAECREEAGIIAEELEFFKKSTLGATVEWDLYVFEVTKWHEADGQALEDGEVIESGNWFSYEEAEEMIVQGSMQEERIALMLLQWIRKQKEVSNEI